MTGVCKFWLLGTCRKGSTCKWKHTNSKWDTIKPKTPYVTFEDIRQIDYDLKVVIKGKWADVEDTDDFFDE